MYMYKIFIIIININAESRSPPRPRSGRPKTLWATRSAPTPHVDRCQWRKGQNTAPDQIPRSENVPFSAPDAPICTRKGAFGPFGSPSRRSLQRWGAAAPLLHKPREATSHWMDLPVGRTDLKVGTTLKLGEPLVGGTAFLHVLARSRSHPSARWPVLRCAFSL